MALMLEEELFYWYSQSYHIRDLLGYLPASTDFS